MKVRLPQAEIVAIAQGEKKVHEFMDLLADDLRRLASQLGIRSRTKEGAVPKVDLAAQVAEKLS